MGTDDVAAAYSRLAAVYDEVVVDDCYAGWAQYLHRRWGSDPAGVRRVLDLCCGTGLMAQELVGLGYGVTGVDGSSDMLARARLLLGREAQLLQQQLPHLDVPGGFDAVVSTFDSLNYLDLEDLRSTVRAVARVLRPGGWFVFDLHTDELMAFTTATPVVTGEQDGYRFRVTTVVDSAARSCDTAVRLERATDGDTFVEEHRQYFHSDTDVRTALARAGLTLVGVEEEYSERPVSPTTLRATWTARSSGLVLVPRAG